MKLNIHDTTPASKTPKWLKGMLAGLFVLFYSIFALGAFAVIFYAGHIAAGVLLAVLPLGFLLWFLWDQRNLAKSHIDITEDTVIVTEYPLGRRTVRTIPYPQIDHAGLVRPYSGKLRGPRIKDVGIPYIVFYDKNGNQLFKLLASPEAIQFQQSITQEDLQYDPKRRM